jgi:hypothetical protein
MARRVVAPYENGGWGDRDAAPYEEIKSEDMEDI